jgi:hypothetical protein
MPTHEQMIKKNSKQVKQRIKEKNKKNKKKKCKEEAPINLVSR